MILQELARYYERKPDDLAPEGFEKKEIPFVIVIDKDGKLVQIEDTTFQVGKRKRNRSFLIPKSVERSSTKVAANLLWDTAEYVLGLDSKGKPESAVRKQAAFLARLKELPAEDAGVRAVQLFLSSIPLEQLKKSQSWEEIHTKNSNLSFQLMGDTELVCERSAVVTALQNAIKDDEGTANAAHGICLISGQEGEIKRLHPTIKGVWDAQPSGARIVSFNKRSFESYGKDEKQGENAPVGKRAAFAYTTALNHLLGKDSTQRIQVGDASTVFWSDAEDPLEGSFASLFAEPPKDNPDANTPAVRALYRSVEQGSMNVSEDKTRFFVLGLAPNAARVAIRFWLTGTVKEFSHRIVDHFNDIAIVPYRDRKSKEPLPPHLSLGRLLRSTALQEESKNIPPSLGGDTIRAILFGLPYPETLLLSALRRIRAEQEVNYPRAALIKACINRKTRWVNSAGDSAPEEELHVSLNLANTNVGYLLGRLFAVLERTQEKALPEINTTIRDRFYGAASSTPITVFPILFKLNKHHLAKIGNSTSAGYLEKLIREICWGLDDQDGLRANLSIADQGRFAIGYYHQKQAFYAKKSEPSEGVQA